MRLTGILTTVMIIGLASSATAQCMWGSKGNVTASTQPEMTTIHEAEATDVADAPVILPLETTETEEG